MAISLGAADEMLSACAEHGTKLVIGHQRRFTRGWEQRPRPRPGRSDWRADLGQCPDRRGIAQLGHPYD